MPPILRKPGRPKGHDVTVIGLPVKKVKKGNRGIQSIYRWEKRNWYHSSSSTLLLKRKVHNNSVNITIMMIIKKL